MMRMEMFTVYDVALGVFGRPMFLQSVGQAIRSFSDEVNRSSDDNQMNKHPVDFSLYHLGTFIDDDASFEVFDQPKRLAEAADLIIKD
ncbi:MAG: nonstructural protein [Microviridae sp.]|nr:MAG: nonstructural protein [Microviridae sp.]